MTDISGIHSDRRPGAGAPLRTCPDSARASGFLRPARTGTPGRPGRSRNRVSGAVRPAHGATATAGAPQ